MNNQQNNSHLSKLYPTPKTYEEQQKNLRQIQLRRQTIPKYLRLKMALAGSIAFLFAILFIQNTETLWTELSPLIGIFSWFAALLVLLYTAYVSVVFIRNAFYRFDSKPTSFNLIYWCYVLVVFLLWNSGWLSSFSAFLWIPIIGIVHFLVILVTLHFTLQNPNVDQEHDEP